MRLDYTTWALMRSNLLDSRSRSPPPKRERSFEKDRRSLSPEAKNGVVSKSGKRSPMPDDVSPRRSRSPRRQSPGDRRDESPALANGKSCSASPRDDRSPVDGDYEDKRKPRGSESP